MSGSVDDHAIDWPGLRPSPIRSPAGHAATYEETERRLAPTLERVPITRVYDASPLDWLGLPVWAAVTPLALDLTVHAGKGLSPTAARISAIMEAIERFSAEQVEESRTVVASYEELAGQGEPALDPELSDLPFETHYRAERPITWIEGFDLLAERPALVALDLVISPAREGVCIGVETNGLATGNTLTEAVTHALGELIERDSASLYRFRRRFATADKQPPTRVVELGSLPTGVAEWVDTVRACGLEVVIHRLGNELSVPVYSCLLSDASFPGTPGRTTWFEGLGADLDPAWALLRAVAEAVQCHTTVVVGARDTIEAGDAPGDFAGSQRGLRTPTVREPFVEGETTLPDDLLQRLQILLGRLRAAGFAHCIAVDLTRPELGIPAVRVLVPGLAGPYGATARRPSLRLLRTLG